MPAAPVAPFRISPSTRVRIISVASELPQQRHRTVTRWSLEEMAFLSDPSHQHVIHCTPKHGSWLNQVELFFGVLQRRFLARGSFRSGREFERCLREFLTVYNARHAHPYRWTYTGEPLVRDTPLSRTRR